MLPRAAFNPTFIPALRHTRAYQSTRKSRTPEETRGKLVAMRPSEERPHAVADRTIPGHGKGDLILGKHQRTALGTVLERMTGYTLRVPLKAKDAPSVRTADAKARRSLPREITKTLTSDQGKEMRAHNQFTIATGMTGYFAHPGSPWERGTNENTTVCAGSTFRKERRLIRSRYGKSSGYSES